MAEEDLKINAKITIPSTELRYATSRSSGPGGQHANKTESRVTVSWNLAASEALNELEKNRAEKKLGPRMTDEGDVQVSVDESRSQFRNKALARKRLAELVNEALKRPRKRIATKPSKSAQRRRVEAKKQRAQIKKLRKTPSRNDHD